jgi:lysophospholipase L1-like esterase
VGATVLLVLAGAAFGATDIARPARSAVTSLQRSPKPATVVTAALKAPVNHRLLVVGASYTQGLGARPQTSGYAYLLGSALGYDTTVDGVAGTGFLNNGPHDQGTFAQRISHEPSSLDPGLVLLQCGRNDLGYPDLALRRAVVRTISLVRQKYARAEIVMLGSIPGDAPVPPDLERLQSSFSDTAKSLGVAFIDPIAQDWITIHDVHGYTGAVPQHPNNAGYAYIAARIVSDLYGLSNGLIGTAHPHIRPAGPSDGPSGGARPGVGGPSSAPTSTGVPQTGVPQTGVPQTGVPQPVVSQPVAAHPTGSHSVVAPPVRSA